VLARRLFSILLVRELGGHATIGKNLGHVSHVADRSRPVFENGPDKGDDHDTKIEPFCRCACSHAIMARLRKRYAAERLDEHLMELVKIRASQINGCVVCLHMHTASARKLGETEERLYLLDAWRESSLYSERETHRTGLD
jgi:AhpD family alkylhydroperoxidase